MASVDYGDYCTHKPDPTPKQPWTLTEIYQCIGIAVLATSAPVLCFVAGSDGQVKYTNKSERPKIETKSADVPKDDVSIEIQHPKPTLDLGR